MPDVPPAAPAANAAPRPLPPAVTPPPAAGATPGQPPPQVPPKVEPPKPDAAKAAADRDAAALARARRVEAANREAEQRIKTEQARFEDERKHHAAELAQAAEYKRLQALKDDPLKAMEALGYTPQQILDRIAKGDAAKTPEEIAKTIVDKTLAERDAKAKQEAEQRQKEAAEQAQVNARAIYARAQDDLTRLVKADPDKYEFCNRLENPGKRAYEIVEEYWKLTEADGTAELLPFHEALETLEEDLEKEHLTFSENSKKLKARAEAEAAAKKKADEEAAAAAAAAKKKGPREARPMSGFKTPPKAPEPTASTAPDAAAAPPEIQPADRQYLVSSRRDRLKAHREKQRPNDA